MATATAKDSRGTRIHEGDLVYSFGWGDNYIVADISCTSNEPGRFTTRIKLVDGQGNSVGWCDPAYVAFVARNGEYDHG